MNRTTIQPEPALPHLVAPSEGEALWFLQTLMVVKATGTQTAGAFTLIVVDYPPGFSPPAHLHRHEDESFYVLDGEVTFQCGERSWIAEPGSFVVLPRGILHGFTVSAERPARMLQISSPAGLENFYRTAGSPATARTLPPTTTDIISMNTAAIDNGLEICSSPSSQTP